jgi:hypothetical protein
MLCVAPAQRFGYSKIIGFSEEPSPFSADSLFLASLAPPVKSIGAMGMSPLPGVRGRRGVGVRGETLGEESSRFGVSLSEGDSSPEEDDEKIHLSTLKGEIVFLGVCFLGVSVPKERLLIERELASEGLRACERDWLRDGPGKKLRSSSSLLSSMMIGEFFWRRFAGAGVKNSTLLCRLPKLVMTTSSSPIVSSLEVSPDDSPLSLINVIDMARWRGLRVTLMISARSSPSEMTNGFEAPSQATGASLIRVERSTLSLLSRHLIRWS